MIVLVPGMMGRGVPAQVRVHPRRAVVIVVVVVDVRVQQRRTKGRQLQSDGRRHGNDRAKHPAIVSPSKAEEFLNSSSEPDGAQARVPEYL